MTDRANTFSLQSLSHSVYGAQWLREWESQGAGLTSVSLYQLMQRAGTAAFQRILWLYPGAHRWLVLAGHGNNGGDGYVVAQLAAAGKQVTVLACGGSSLCLPKWNRLKRRGWRPAEKYTPPRRLGRRAWR
ncbi:Bifunctional NAD(P)H-hydrate repair enzyme Nnr [Sodalis praecaptivus]